MRKALWIALIGLTPTPLAATGAEAAGKTIDMGYIDQATISRACQEVGTVPFTGGSNYGCRARNGSITCNSETCTASGSDLAPVTGNSLRAVMDALGHRAGRKIMPLDTKVDSVNQRVQ